MLGKLGEIILEVLRNTLGPLQSYTGVTFLTDATNVHRRDLHEPYRSHNRNLRGMCLEMGLERWDPWKNYRYYVIGKVFSRVAIEIWFRRTIVPLTWYSAMWSSISSFFWNEGILLFTREASVLLDELRSPKNFFIVCLLDLKYKTVKIQENTIFRNFHFLTILFFHQFIKYKIASYLNINLGFTDQNWSRWIVWIFLVPLSLTVLLLCFIWASSLLDCRMFWCRVLSPLALILSRAEPHSFCVTGGFE